MGNVNIGSQIVHWRYRQPAVTEDVNQWFFNIFEPGVFHGGDLQKIDNDTIRIFPVAVLIETPTQQLIKVQTTEEFLLNVSPINNIITCSFVWQNEIENYMDFNAKPESSITPTEIILGECIFDSSDILTHIDYLKKKLGTLKID